MDNAVALVRAYLGVNGYFSVTEDPVLVPGRGGGQRQATDIDVLAVRLPHAHRGKRHRGDEPPTIWHDPMLDCSPHHLDLLIAEVKEHATHLNSAMRKPRVLQAALRRFDCFAPNDLEQLARRLMEDGQVEAAHGIHVRLIVFGHRSHEQRFGNPPAIAISMAHITDFLQTHIRDHWSTLSHAQFKDPALGFLFTLEKARRERDTESERTSHERTIV